MILTVTPNPALDLTWHVDRLTPGATHRVRTGVARAGGKGVNVARVLHGRHIDVLALATSGGATGAEFTRELDSSGIPHHVVPIGGATRRSVAIVDDERGETAVFNEHGAPLDAAESSALLDAAARLGRASRVVAICGSLPPGVSPDALGALVEGLVAAGTRVVVDTSGPGLLAAARAGAHALKPNRDELEAAMGHADPVSGARALLDLGAGLVVVSLGAEGLVCVSRADAAGGLRARLPRVLHGNATGAGDALVAAIAAALADTPDLHEDTDVAAAARSRLARRAAAWSASAVLMPLAGELSPQHDALEAEVVVESIAEEHA
ncbi:1-phosphofructokinase family hexose kinase [Agromyces albus]|uniref:1-phosphofructokinase family hexose kinase n=1 Tax=Agromyces albus TaxID=205332 RepID=UPI002781C80E|nr:1-phosphofructokinase family hexose kinase [Agromyces albus]MDQ0576250.1 1-phosphofructokinase family hexose kinase [Agromyces albus]